MSYLIAFTEGNSDYYYLSETDGTEYADSNFDYAKRFSTLNSAQRKANEVKDRYNITNVRILDEADGGAIDINGKILIFEPYLASTKKSKNVKKSITDDLEFNGGRIIVSRGGGDSGTEWDFLDYTMELEDNGDESALDDLYEKINSGKEKFSLHRANGWDYDITIIKSTKKSKMKKTGDLPRAGDVYINDYGGSCKIISVDEPSLSDEYQLDNFQIAYQMGDSYPICHKWKDVKVMLEYNGYNYQASAKKSKSVKKDYDGEEDEVVEEYRGVEIWLFAEDGVYGIVDDEGEIIESYDDIESVKDYIDHIVPYDASAKKSYTPDYQDFRSMVGSIRNTGNHNRVFKE